MRCRQFGYRYALVIRSQSPFDDERGSNRIHVIVASQHWSPAADVYETEDKISIVLEIAGADPEELEIMLYEDALIIHGNRSIKPTSSQGMYHLAEIRQGPFCFELPLSKPFTQEQVETKYDNGLLSITLKKRVE